VIVPAHDEERTIGRLLQALTGSPAAPLEVVVVANACHDATADVARGFGVTVIETSTPGKPHALELGNTATAVLPRVYVDADVEIDAASVAALARAVTDEGFLAAGPVRLLPREGVDLAVRWYYDVWERLPQVRTGLFGRGVIALSAEGLARVRALPAVMSDDLAVSEAFAPEERLVVVDAKVVVRPPRTVRDLLRRRIRVATGNAQADAAGLRGEAAATRPATLARLVREDPALAPRVVVFLAIAAVARLRARRAVRRDDYSTWLRDESSRASA
jgi:hypothetical protein